ncbi:MAG: hypothetical protein EXS13_03970 [Planctomycetes bacterium]|nr:hypothetical protein [Planctomycetota bacterium]
MLDRESSFADAQVIETLQKRFVPLALDVWYEERREDAAGELFRKVVYQREGLEPGRTTQGFYAFAPDGKLLQGWNHRGVDRLKEHLKKALDDYEPPKAAALTGVADARFDRTLPDGARIVDVHARITKADWPEPKDGYERVMQAATSSDHLWIVREEIAALGAGTFPTSLATRIARFHCIDNTRGEPPLWEIAEVQRAEIKIEPDPKRAGTAGVAKLAALSAVEGTISLRSADGERGYDARVGGSVEIKDGALTKFDLAIRGDFFGSGEYTRNAPPGKFTLAIVFTLADAVDTADGDQAARVPPQGARWLDDYLGKVNGRQ